MGQAAKYAKMLEEIDQVTVSLQTEGLALADCRNDLEKLIMEVEEQIMVPGAPLYGCKLGSKKWE